MPIFSLPSSILIFGPKSYFLWTRLNILKKHLYCTKLDYLPNIFTNTQFFRQNKRLPFSTLHFDEIFMLKFEIFSTERTKKMLKKFVKVLWLIKKCLRNIWIQIRAIFEHWPIFGWPNLDWNTLTAFGKNHPYFSDFFFQLGIIV